ncbi:MAG TPA: hypothetical protein VHO95_05090 [Candidatus Dormibacteraeota bacterium]|nr:hypothetical protein [Candidatus Dormibacteraeota bacterium]HEX2680802.1 hypothetical protein [Candidatus Dormibacteraeota bacterium]
MTKRLAVLGALIAASAIGAAPAYADTATQQYGPFASGSTDSGTCGNDWANDTFNRHFTVLENPDGTFTVVEEFKDGTFTTPASDSPAVNFSPGACQGSASPAGVVAKGVTGTLEGYFIIPVPAGFKQTSADSNCNAAAHTNAGCTTSTFINTHFSCTYLVTCQVTTFLFHYAAGGQGLLSHEWKNASADRGGNSGDIRSSNLA